MPNLRIAAMLSIILYLLHFAFWARQCPTSLRRSCVAVYEPLLLTRVPVHRPTDFSLGASRAFI
jgi:hypothetical protein